MTHLWILDCLRLHTEIVGSVKSGHTTACGYHSLDFACYDVLRASTRSPRNTKHLNLKAVC